MYLCSPSIALAVTSCDAQTSSMPSCHLQIASPDPSPFFHHNDCCLCVCWHILWLFITPSVIVQRNAHRSHISIGFTTRSFIGWNEVWYLLPSVFGRTPAPTRLIFGRPPTALSFPLFFASSSLPRYFLCRCVHRPHPHLTLLSLPTIPRLFGLVFGKPRNHI